MLEMEVPYDPAIHSQVYIPRKWSKQMREQPVPMSVQHRSEQLGRGVNWDVTDQGWQTYGTVPQQAVCILEGSKMFTITVTDECVRDEIVMQYAMEDSSGTQQ